jgi:hypothetical protein
MENQNLFERVKKLVATERRIGIEILECLYEIEKRKAYAELRYDGLFTYCVKELGFTDAQAYQRIQAMRALKEIPELKSMIEEGSLNVSSVSKVQVHLRKELKEGVRYDKNEKLELFKLMENQTTKQVDQKLMELSGKKIQVKLVLELDEESEQLWNRVKSLSAHKTQNDDLSSFKMLMKEWLNRNDPLLKKERVNIRATKENSAALKSESPQKLSESGVETKTQPSVRRAVPLLIKVTPRNDRSSHASLGAADASLGASASLKTSASNVSSKTTASIPTTSRFIPAALSRMIWQRDLGKCTHCGSTHALQIDHIRPFAKGGTTEASNLRLLCRSCNLHFAIKQFGMNAVKRVGRDAH